jgi:acetyl-CoA C-acetyltransferase
VETDSIVIAGVARTPIGGFMGALSALPAPTLGAAAIRAAVQRAGVPGDEIDEVVFGNCLMAGVGQAPARQAALGGGLPQGCGATTLTKMCGSGMKATMLGYDMLRAESARIVVAGGMESMSNAPHLIPKARRGIRLGHGRIYDHMFLDGLEDAYEKGRLMGSFAEDCVDRYRFTRVEQDDYARESLLRARRANEEGLFDWELTPVDVAVKGRTVRVERDEQPFLADIAKIGELKPAFRPDGTITPANASSISDGAAALVLMRESTAKTLGVEPVARILGHASHAQEPAWFATAPAVAMEKLLHKLGWTAATPELYEINEAFAAVTLAAMRDHKLDHARVNVHGGACALGHPIGASGARIIVTLIGALRQRGLSRGMASLCIGGGEATAMAVELL